MRRYQITVGGRLHVVDVQELGANTFHVVVEGQALDVTLSGAEDVTDTVISPEIVPAHESHPSTAPFRPASPDTLPPMVPAALPPLPPPTGPRGETDARGPVTAPMPGTITAVAVQPGEAVTTGQVLVKLEAMKMVNAIKAPRDGVVGEIRVRAGENVGYGQVLVTWAEA